jgi:hypothetical protein
MAENSEEISLLWVLSPALGQHLTAKADAGGPSNDFFSLIIDKSTGLVSSLQVNMLPATPISGRTTDDDSSAETGTSSKPMVFPCRCVVLPTVVEALVPLPLGVSSGHTKSAETTSVVIVGATHAQVDDFCSSHCSRSPVDGALVLRHAINASLLQVDQGEIFALQTPLSWEEEAAIQSAGQRLKNWKKIKPSVAHASRKSAPQAFAVDDDAFYELYW